MTELRITSLVGPIAKFPAVYYIRDINTLRIAPGLLVSLQLEVRVRISTHKAGCEGQFEADFEPQSHLGTGCSS